MLDNEANSTYLLRQAIKDAGYSLDAFASKALIPHTTLHRKLKKPASLTIGELQNIFDAMADTLDGDEVLDIVAALLWEEGEN